MVNANGEAFCLPRLILGTWALGGGNDWGDTSESDALSTIACALEHAITTFDTAPVYGVGQAEERLGKALKGRRHRVQIATKCGIVLKNGRPDHDLRPQSILAECEASLRRLQTDYIDLYQIHWPDPKVDLADSLGALLRLQEQGKIRAIGVCNFSPKQVELAHKIAPIISVQNQFSLLSDKQTVIRVLCEKKQLKFLAYGVLGGGILSGKYKQAPNFRRCDARRYFYPYYFKEGFSAAAQVAARVKELASQKNLSPAALALAWALHQRAVSSVLFGARTAKQVQDNVQAANVKLTKEELEFLSYD